MNKRLVTSVIPAILAIAFGGLLIGASSAKEYYTCEMKLTWVGGVLPVPQCNGECCGDVCGVFHFNSGGHSMRSCVCDPNGAPYTSLEFFCFAWWDDDVEIDDAGKLTCYTVDCAKTCTEFDLSDPPQDPPYLSPTCNCPN